MEPTLRSYVCTIPGKLLTSLALLVMTSTAYSASIGLGIARAPEFSGSDDYLVSPTATFEVETPFGILKNNRVGAQFDIIKSTNVDTGPILRYHLGRNDEASDEIVSALPEIEGTLEAGWFIGSGFKLSSIGLTSDAIVIGNIAAVTDVGDGHGGTAVSGSVGLVMQVSEQLRFIPSFKIEYVDDNYANSFYSVSAESAAQFGLAEFKAGGGLESTQVALVAIRDIDEHWSLTGVAGYTTLQDDAASSPITVERGSDKQVFTGLTVNYRF